MSSALAYFLFALVSLPLWWPALRAVLGDVRAAAEPETLAPPSAAPLVQARAEVPWSTTRTRLAALASVRRHSSPRRWEGGFGRRSP